VNAEDPERMPVHESPYSGLRGGANGFRLAAIVWLSLQGAFRNFQEWRHPPLCPFCSARLANTELHCHRCGADLPEMMFRSPAEGVGFDAILLCILLTVFAGLSWMGRGEGPIYGWWLKGLRPLVMAPGWVPPALRHLPR
jgi:hypothetical protein